MAYDKKANQTVKNIKYDKIELSNEGERFEIRDVWMPKAQSWSTVYKSLNKPFSYDYLTSPRLPINLGKFDFPDFKDLPRILRLTIKPVNSFEVSLPKELLSIKDTLQKILEYDRMINTNFYESEIHITLDHGIIQAQETQRFPGWHVDGLQGGKFKTKLVAEHSYVMATNNPTEFCLQPFFVKHYDEDITNNFKAFDQQAQECNIYKGIPYNFYLMDAYMVHRTPIIKETTERGFIRITVANAPLPIEYNTLNPMIQKEPAPFKLDIRDWLREPTDKINYEYYGLDEKPEVKEKISLEELQRLRKEAKQDTGTFDNKELTPGKPMIIKNKNFPKVQPLSPTYDDMLEPFNPFKYTNPRLPIDLGIAPVEEIQSTPNVLRMLLKWENSDEIRIPEEFKPIRNLLNRIFTYDKAHNPLFHEEVAHITHDSRVVEHGKTHRFPGFHGDDLQGGAFPTKEIAAHSYILTTEPGTEFCLQPFFVAHIDDTFERHFTEFDKQAMEENIYKVKSGHMYLMDPYAVHRTPQDAGEGLRTFLRITFSTKNMLLPHNTINPMFKDIQEEYDNLETPHLWETFFTQESDRKIPYEYYGLGGKSN